MPTVSIIGMGRVGNALFRSLSTPFSVIERYGRRSVPEVGVSALKDSQNIVSDLIVITTNDDSIADVVRSLSERLVVPRVVLHTSGSLSSSVLNELKNSGCSIASMHPLVSVTETNAANVFRGAYFCLEGDEAAVASASSIVENLGGIPFTIATDKKPLYHAAAVMAAGHVVALIDMADEMMQASGVERETSLRILKPLVASVVLNLFDNGAAQSLTGTYSRGDIATAKRHLAALGNDVDPLIRSVFIDLALHSLEIARSGGIDDLKAKEIETLLNVAKEHREL